MNDKFISSVGGMKIEVSIVSDSYIVYREYAYQPVHRRIEEREKAEGWSVRGVMGTGPIYSPDPRSSAAGTCEG